MNFLINGGIAWALFHSAVSVPLWGQASVAGDTFISAFLLPLFTCVFVTRIVRGQVTQGRVLPIAELPPPGVPRFLVSLSALGRGTVLGLGGVVLVALPTVLWFVWAGPSELPRDSFLWFKASFAAVLAAGVTPFIGWLALVEPPSDAS